MHNQVYVELPSIYCQNQQSYQEQPLQQNIQIQQNLNTEYQQKTQIMHTREPIIMQCPYCQCQIMTQVDYKIGKGQWLFGLLLIKTMICCILPFLVKDCKDVIHKCPQCRNIIGKKNFIFE